MNSGRISRKHSRWITIFEGIAKEILRKSPIEILKELGNKILEDFYGIIPREKKQENITTSDPEMSNQ